MTNETKPKKTFILGKHHADLLKSSEKELYFEISNDQDYNTTLLSIDDKVIKKIGKIIYDRVMLIDTNVASVKEITGNIMIIHRDDSNREIQNTSNGKIVVTTYESGTVSIMLYANNEICERISFKLTEVSVE